jgi:hypothetical protein
MKTDYKYLKFILGFTQPPKTSVWLCKNIQSGDVLGTVKYYPAWRQYCYFPQSCTVFNDGCLRDIADFLSQLDTDRKEKRKAEHE